MKHTFSLNYGTGVSLRCCKDITGHVNFAFLIQTSEFNRLIP